MAGRGGARKGAGRPKVTADNPDPKTAPRKGLAAEIRASLGGKFRNHKDDCKCEGCLWKRDAEQIGEKGRAARQVLWDRDEGKSVHVVNHLHDKPIEMNVNVKLSELIRQVRERKREYERNRG